MMKISVMVIFVGLLLSACDEIEKARAQELAYQQLIDKYKQADKYGDFDIFQFKGIQKLPPTTRPPYVQMLETKDSVFLLITRQLGVSFEKKFQKVDNYYYEQELLTWKGKERHVVDCYFFKTHYLVSIYNEKNLLDTNRSVSKTTPNEVQAWMYVGDKEMIDIKVSPDFREKRLLSRYLKSEIKNNLFPTDSLLIIRQETSVYGIPAGEDKRRIDTLEFPLYTFVYKHKFSPFWQIYVSKFSYVYE